MPQLVRVGSGWLGVARGGSGAKAPPLAAQMRASPLFLKLPMSHEWGAQANSVLGLVSALVPVVLRRGLRASFVYSGGGLYLGSD